MGILTQAVPKARRVSFERKGWRIHASFTRAHRVASEVVMTRYTRDDETAEQVMDELQDLMTRESVNQKTLKHMCRQAKAAEIPIEDLCREAGVTTDTFYRILNGTRQGGAAQINRLETALKRLKETAPTMRKKKRRCLYCRKEFLSSHAGNRRCKRCTHNLRNVVEFTGV